MCNKKPWPPGRGRRGVRLSRNLCFTALSLYPVQTESVRTMPSVPTQYEWSVLSPVSCGRGCESSCSRNIRRNTKRLLHVNKNKEFGLWTFSWLCKKKKRKEKKNCFTVTACRLRFTTDKHCMSRTFILFLFYLKMSFHLDKKKNQLLFPPYQKLDILDDMCVCV